MAAGAMLSPVSRWVLDKLLTVAEAADKASVCSTIVYGWVGSGDLPHYRLGAKGRRGKIAIAEGDLHAFLQARKVTGRRDSVLPPLKSQRAKVQASAFLYLPLS
jgi:hypothetical protein